MRSLMDEVLELGPNGTSLTLLLAIYRNPTIPLPVRMRAAGMALPHEHPRLMVTAQVNEQSFAEILDRRLKRLKEMENVNPSLRRFSVKLESVFVFVR